MHRDDILKSAEKSTLSRRKLLAFAAAGSAATLPAVASAEASEKTSRLPQPPELPLDKQLDICVANLKNVLARMYPDCGPLKYETVRSDEGRFELFYMRSIARGAVS